MRKITFGGANSLAVAASVAIWWECPEWQVVATLTQVAVSIDVLVYLKVNPCAV